SAASPATRRRPPPPCRRSCAGRRADGGAGGPAPVRTAADDRSTRARQGPMTGITFQEPAAPCSAGAPGGAELRRAATAVLLRNWTGRSTLPSRSLYPHQWSWDSAFIALGLRHVSARRAQQELESMLGAQWADGRLPHIVFDPATPADAYFPGPP